MSNGWITDQVEPQEIQTAILASTLSIQGTGKPMNANFTYLLILCSL